MKRSLISTLILISSVFISSGEMVFEKQLVEIHAKPDQKEVTGEFPFVIKSKDETIKSYDAKCSCLEAGVLPLNPDRSAKLTWKVGEKGMIMARFDTSKFLGTVDKAIELNLEGASEPINLVVRVHVPVLVKIEPATLRWDVGGKNEEKVMKVTIQHDKPIKITSHKGNNPKFPYEFKTIREGWEYEIRVKPVDTAQSGIGMLALRTDSEFARFRRSMAYLVTKPKIKKLSKAIQK